MSGPRHSRFSPHVVDQANLERLFVEREPLLARLVDDVSAGVVEGGARYVLLVGPRGAGKSHLAALLRARLSARLQGSAILAGLDEEEHVGSLLDLLARVLRAFPPDPSIPDAQVQLRSLRGVSHEEAVERAVGLIEARLADRALILSFENADQLFEDLGREGQQVLRRVLQAHPRWSMVATSRTLGPMFVRPQQPFFNTFAVHSLEALPPEGCRELLARLADVDGREDLASFLRTPTGLARVRAIHHFAGGNPRAMALLHPYLTLAKLDELVEAFYDLSEELTPYFQEQMSRLPAGQRPILEALAENWRPMSPGELAEALFQAPAAVSMQLKRLREDRLVTALSVGRERFYEIAEPLHRLARAMKRTDGVGAALARFLRHWHQPGELEGLLGLEGLLEAELRAHVSALRVSESEESPYDAAERESIEGCIAGEALARAREFHMRRQTPVSAGVLVDALLAGEIDEGVIEELRGMGGDVRISEGQNERFVARFGLLLKADLTAARSFAEAVICFRPAFLPMLVALQYDSGDRAAALSSFRRIALPPLFGALNVAYFELALLQAGDELEALRVGDRLPVESDDEHVLFSQAVVRFLHDGDRQVFVVPLRGLGQHIAAGLLRVLSAAPGRLEAVPVPSDNIWWHASARLATLAIAATMPDTPFARAAIERLEAHFDLPDQITARALLSLPADRVPFARLAREERAMGRQFLAFFGATERLAALPAEASFE